MSKKVFADFHHSDLYHSLFLLFEKRLGFELYRPIGLDWFKEGFWKIAEPYGNKQDTIDQFLSLQVAEGVNSDGTPLLNKVEELENGYYKVKDGWKEGYFHRAITLKQFKKQKFDLIIASYPLHLEPYKKLLKLYQPQAKFIFQQGNNWQLDYTKIPNLMSSTAEFPVSGGCNAIFYHQEFDLDDFSFVPPKRYNRITNFMHYLPQSIDYPLWKEYKKLLPEYEFKMHGAGGDDGVIPEKIYNYFKETTFVWHLKYGGDGYGHLIHNAFATGRPPIVKASYYRGQLAEKLMEDEVTCIDLDKRRLEDNLKVIRKWSKPANYRLMSQNAYNRFKQVVDFDKEEIKIREFLEKLK